MVAIKDMKEIPKSCCDEDKLCPLFNEETGTCNGVEEFIMADTTMRRFPNCPLVEIEERKVGKWVYKKLGDRTYGLVCSCCNYILCEGQNYDSLEEFKAWVNKRLIEPNIELDYFCHKCGADMRGAENGKK